MTRSIESLESRRLLTVTNPAQELIHLDDLQTQYPHLTGSGQTIALIDTGVNYSLDVLGGGLGSGFKVIGGYDFVDNDSDPMDTDGHGTQTASVIAAEEYSYNGQTFSGIAPDAKLVSLRVGSSDSISDARVRSALNWVIDHADEFGISVVNMSLGSGSDSSEVTNGQYSTQLATLASMGILVAVASGNSGDSTFGNSGVAYPASDANAFAVGSVRPDDIISAFTQRNELLDLLAVGDNVIVPKLGGGFESVDGTSFAAPAVAGAAALIYSISSSFNAIDVASILKTSGATNYDDNPISGRTTELSFSRLNVLSAVELAQARSISTTSALDTHDATTLDSAYDSAGILHLVWHDKSNGDLMYATQNTDGQWSKPVRVDGRTFDAGSYLSLAIDSADKPSIAYYNASQADLKFATFNDGNWKTRKVDTHKAVGQYVSLTFDGDNEAVISYYAKSGGNLKIAVYDRATDLFSKSTIDSEGDVGAYSSIDYIFTGGISVVAIGYVDRTHGALKYARYGSDATGSGWTTLTVDDLQGVANVDLNLQAAQAQIAYRDTHRGDVKFTYLIDRSTNTWGIETIASSGSVGQQIDLFYDSNGNANIAYYNRTKDAYYLATSTSGRRAEIVDGGWSNNRIGPGGAGLTVAISNGSSTLLAVNRTGRDVLKKELA